VATVNGSVGTNRRLRHAALDALRQGASIPAIATAAGLSCKQVHHLLGAGDENDARGEWAMHEAELLEPVRAARADQIRGEVNRLRRELAELSRA
jgi:hypothetical protein